MQEAIGKLERFANDFYRFLALRYHTRYDYRIKVVGGSRDNWNDIIPSKLLEPKDKPQFQHPYFAFDWSGASECSAEDKMLGLISIGFAAEHAKDFSNYDALLFINFSKPIRMESGEPYLWNVLIAHHIIHLVEVLINQQLIDEPATEHKYTDPEALQHLHRFLAWVGGLDEAIDRYVPCRK
jgi:hypothetical protein